MWGAYRTTVYVNSSPTTGGYVYVGSSNDCGESSCTKTSDDAVQGKDGFKTSGSFTWYFCHKANANYVFKGWSTDQNANTGEGASSNPWSKSLNATISASSITGGNSYTYYAIFARMTANQSSLDFGSTVQGIDNTKEVKLTTVHAGEVSISLENNNGAFSLTGDVTGYNSITTEEVKTITVHYNPSVPGKHSATLKITGSNGMTTINIPLVGESKYTATMSWKEGTNIMNLYETLSAEALTCSDPTRAITFTSSDSSIIDIVEGVPVAIAVGSATITAIQAENAEFYQTTAAQEITVTSKQKQILDWTDKLSFKFEGTPFVQELTAQAQTELTYSLSDVKDNCVSLEGNVLTIKAAGTAYVTATAVETDEFVGVSMTRKIIIRDANASCETFIYGPSAEYEFDLGWNAASHQTKTKEIDFGGQEPRYVNFDYKGKSHNVIIEYYNGTLRIDQYVNGGWQEVKNLGTPTKNGNYTNTGNISLNRKATKMRVRAEDGMGYMYFKDCVVTLAKYLESSTDALQFDAQVGVSQTKTFNISYSDVQGPIEITSSNSNILSFSQNAIEADCEQHGTVQITVTLNSTAVIDQIAETITISNGVEAPLTIAVSGSVTKRGQEILWNDATTYYAIENPTLTATATSELPITYTSGNTELAQVVNDNQLAFYSAGTVDITATQEGNDLYKAASMTKTFTINIVPTQIVTAPALPDSVVLGTTLEELILEGGKAQNTVNQGEVVGSFAITEGDLSTLGENQLTITFTPSNTNIYTPSSTTITLKVVSEIVPLNRTLIWEAAAENTVYTIDTVLLSAKVVDDNNAPAGEVAFAIAPTSTEGCGQLVDTTLTFAKAGQVTINATVADDPVYVSIEPISKVWNVVITPTEITTAPTTTAEVVMGTTIEDLVLEGGAAQNTITNKPVEGTFAITDGDLSTVGTHDLTVTFTPNNTDMYATATTTIQVTVSLLNRTLVWEAAEENTVYTIDTVVLNAKVVDDNNAPAGEVAFALAETSTEGCGQLVDTTLTFAKAGQVTINATVADDPVYVSIEPVSKVWNVVITPTEITTAPTTTAEVVMGTTLADLVLEGGAAQNTITNKPVEGTFAITDGDLSTVGTHDLTVTFTPNNTYMYATATTTISISVIVVLQPTELTWATAPDTIYVETETAFFEASSNREGDIIYTIVQDSDVVSLDIDVPGLVTILTTGTFTIQASQAATDVYEAATIEKTVEVKKMSSPTELQNNAATSNAKKVIINNQIVILREDGIYSITGQKIR